MRRREIERLLEEAVAEALNVDLGAVKRDRQNAVARQPISDKREQTRVAA